MLLQENSIPDKISPVLTTLQRIINTQPSMAAVVVAPYQFPATPEEVGTLAAGNANVYCMLAPALFEFDHSDRVVPIPKLSTLQMFVLLSSKLGNNYVPELHRLWEVISSVNTNETEDLYVEMISCEAFYGENRIGHNAWELNINVQ